MNKILLIIQREYLSRVKKKAFLVLTILVPVMFIAMISLIAFITIKQNDFGDVKKVEVIDASGKFINKLKSTKNLEYTYKTTSYAEGKATFIKEKFDYLLYIPDTINDVQLLGEKKAGIMTSSKIEDELTAVISSQRLAIAGIDSGVLAKAQKPVKVSAMQVTANGIKDAHAKAAYGIGYLCAFLIYLSLLIYGSQVMRGVIEEKVSRVVEVIISSVKPFQLMLGKIIGIGLVGLTQFFLWIVISISLYTAVLPVIMKEFGNKTELANGMPDKMKASQVLAESGSGDNEFVSLIQDIGGMKIAFTIGCFLFYFLFGYLLYSAIFAAVGSAVDNETETQQFVFPITMPLIFTFMLAQTFIINNPDSNLAIWMSMIPFTAPIAMMIRIPFGVPMSQIALSMAFMVLGFLFTTWAAGRIYRVGILMYGKKASYKEMAKWFMYRD